VAFKVGEWGADSVLLVEGAWVGNQDLFPASFGCWFGGFSGVHGCFELGKMRGVCSSCVVEGDGFWEIHFPAQNFWRGQILN
jgi:hypothetical protein